MKPLTDIQELQKIKAWDKELEMFHDEIIRIDFKMQTIVVFSKSEDDYPSPELPLSRFELYFPESFYKARTEELEQEILQWQQNCNQFQEDVNVYHLNSLESMDELAKEKLKTHLLEQQLKQAVEVAKFYSMSTIYAYSPVDDNPPMVILDGGEKARSFLQQLKEREGIT